MAQQMHESIIYQKQQRPSLPNKSRPQQKNYEQYSMTSPKASQTSNIQPSTNSNQLLDYAFNIMKILLDYQQQIQVLKQMLTTRSDFNPEALFNYLSSNQTYIDRKNLLYILIEQNSTKPHQQHEQQFKVTQQQVKIYLNSYGYKDRLDYSGFINIIFPVDVSLLKYITVTGIKKYFNLKQVTQQVLCIFLFLLKKQIEMIEVIQNFKNQSAIVTSNSSSFSYANNNNNSMNKVSRKQIKNLLRIIKKNGQGNSQMEIESQPYIKYEDLKSLFKNLLCYKKGKKIDNKETVETQSQSLYSSIQRNLPSIFRKLSMGKNNFINLQDLEFWLRPWAKCKNTQNSAQDPNNPTLSAIFRMSQISQNEVQNYNDTEIVEQRYKNIIVPLSHQCE